MSLLISILFLLVHVFIREILFSIMLAIFLGNVFWNLQVIVSKEGNIYRWSSAKRVIVSKEGTGDRQQRGYRWSSAKRVTFTGDRQQRGYRWSSAKRVKFKNSDHLGKSLIKIKNNGGRSIEHNTLHEHKVIHKYKLFGLSWNRQFYLVVKATKQPIEQNCMLRCIITSEWS